MCPCQTSSNKEGSPEDRDSLLTRSCVVLSGGVAGDLTVLAGPQHPLRLALELADALPGYAELLAELRESCRVLVVEAIATDQHVPVALGESLYGLAKLGCLHLPHHRSGRVGCPLVLDELAELRAVVVRGEGLIEAGSVRHGVLDVAYLVDRPLESLGDLLVGRLTLELGRKLVIGPGHLPDLLGHVHRYPYRAALVRHRPLHRLPYPPRRVGGEAEATVGVVLLDGLHEAYVALLDEVLEGQPVAAVLLGYRNHETEVLLDEALAGAGVAGLGPP